MSNRDEREFAQQAVIDEEPEWEDETTPEGWFFNLSDGARRREEDLTRELRRALLEDYRRADEGSPTKRLFSKLLGRRDEAEEAEEAPRPQRAVLVDRLERPQPRPTQDPFDRQGEEMEEEEVAPVAPTGLASGNWRKRKVSFDDLRTPTRGVDPDEWRMRSRQPGQAPPRRILQDGPVGQFLEEAEAADEQPVRLEQATTGLTYDGPDDWTTSMTPATVASVLEDLGIESRVEAPAAALEPTVEPGIESIIDGWSSEPVAPEARQASPAEEALDEAVQVEEEPVARVEPQPARRPRIESQPAPAATPVADGVYSTEIDRQAVLDGGSGWEFADYEPQAIVAAPVEVEEDGEPEAEAVIPEGAVAADEPRDQEPAEEPRSRWDEMLEAHKGDSNIVDAMRSVWSTDAGESQEAPATPRLRLVPREDEGAGERDGDAATDDVDGEAAAEVTVQPETTAFKEADGWTSEPVDALEEVDETGRLIGKIGGLIRRRRPEDEASLEAILSGETDESPIDRGTARVVEPETEKTAGESEIPEALWSELFGTDSTRPRPLPTSRVHRGESDERARAAQDLAAPLMADPGEGQPIDDDISLEQIFGEGSPAAEAELGTGFAEATGEADAEAAAASPEAADTTGSHDKLPPVAAVWLDEEEEATAEFAVPADGVAEIESSKAESEPESPGSAWPGSEPVASLDGEPEAAEALAEVEDGSESDGATAADAGEPLEAILPEQVLEAVGEVATGTDVEDDSTAEEGATAPEAALDTDVAIGGEPADPTAPEDDAAHIEASVAIAPAAESEPAESSESPEEAADAANGWAPEAAANEPATASIDEGEPSSGDSSEQGALPRIGPRPEEADGDDASEIQYWEGHG